MCWTAMRFVLGAFLMLAGLVGPPAVLASADSLNTAISSARFAAVHTLEGHPYVSPVVLSPDGKTLAIVSPDKSVLLWDIASGSELRRLVGHSDTIQSVAFSPDGRMIASAGDDKSIILWDVSSGQPLRRLIGHEASVHSVAFSPNGRMIASGSQDKTIGLWDAATGKRLRTLLGHEAYVEVVVFSPRGGAIASLGYDSSIKIWDPTSGQTLRTFSADRFDDLGDNGPARSIAFAPDGQTIVSGSRYERVTLWDAKSGRELWSREAHQNEVTSVAISPDGGMIASGSLDKGIKLWAARSGEILGTLVGHGDGVRSVSFSGDGKTIVSGSEDNSIKLWGAAALVAAPAPSHAEKPAPIVIAATSTPTPAATQPPPAAGPAELSASEARRKTCASGAGDAALAACTEEINSGRASGAALAKLHDDRALQYFAKGDQSAARRDFDEAIRLEPASALYLTHRAYFFFGAGAKALALADFDEAVRVAPVAQAYENRGYFHFSVGDVGLALDDYNEAIRLDPNFDYPHSDRGKYYLDKGDLDRALADFERAIQLNPKLGEAYDGRGDVYRAKGDKVRALADYQTARMLLPPVGLLQPFVGAVASRLQAKIAELQAAPTSPTQNLDRRVALVIGNAAYPNAALANPAFDADLISASLKKAGFDVMEVKDADFAKFDQALTGFAAKAENADIALFYFAGHGFALAGDDLRPRNYLIATSADMSATSDAVLRRDGFSIDEVMKRISAPAKVTLAFIDACRNDPFHRGGSERGFAPLGVTSSKQIYIGMSTHLGKTAIDGVGGKGSPFAQAFVEKMTTPGLRIDDAFRALREEVSQKTDGAQEPEILQDDLKQGALVLVRSP